MSKIDKILRIIREFRVAIILCAVTVVIMLYCCAIVKPQGFLEVMIFLFMLSIFHFFVSGLLFPYEDSIIKLLANGLSPMVAIIVFPVFYNLSMGLEFLKFVLAYVFCMLLGAGCIVVVAQIFSWCKNDENR